MPSSDKSRFESLKKLRPTEIPILEALALFYAPVRLDTLHNVLKEGGVQGENRKPITQAGLLQTLEQFKRLRLA